MTFPSVVAAAKAAGTLVIRANGNSNTTPPGGTPEEVQTASVGSGLTRSSFSNYGASPMTDLAAPGESVESTIPGGGYGAKSGTSMAAPHVAGACALVRSVRPDLTAAAVEAVLKQTAQPIGTPTPNTYTGYGLVRPDRAIAALALEGPSVVVAPPVYQTTTTACAAVNGTMPFTATTDASWLTVWTTPDRRVCWTADLARAPQGTTTDRIYLKSGS
jgi:subtilisin family serine protease